MGLDMCTLFKAALKPVLSALRAGHEEYAGLAASMLSRLALDRRLIPQSMAEASLQIISLFCESRKQDCVAPCQLAYKLQLHGQQRM